MSLAQAKAFVEKMKSNEVFRERILAAGDVEQRLDKCRTEGFDFTLEDIEALQASCVNPQLHESNLSLSWQSGGPCHTKCAPIM